MSWSVLTWPPTNEDLPIPHLMQQHHLAQSIADIAWGQFVQTATTKAAWAGRRVVQVDPKYTSQQCSQWSPMVRKSLTVRQHQCPTCQLVMDRDEHAAMHILRHGLASLGFAPRSPGIDVGE